MRKNNKYLNCHLSFSQENDKGASNYKIIKSGRSLDLAYQLGAMTMVGLFSFNAYAECTPTPDCASIGYTETSCEGDSLKCPFDITKMMCMPCDSSYRYTCSGDDFSGGEGNTCNSKYASCTCSDSECVFINGICTCPKCPIGHIYYADSSCSQEFNEAKIPIGVVVKGDTLIMSIEHPKIGWGTFEPNIEALPNIQDRGIAITDYDGKNNTLKLVTEQTYAGLNSSKSAAIYCHEYSTSGTSAGDWYLPAMGELYNYVHLNYNKLNAVYTTNLILDTFNSYFWSSTEYNSAYAWSIAVNHGYMGDFNKPTQYNVSCFLAID